MAIKDPAKRWVTLAALAEEKGVKVQTVSNWIRRGKIPWKETENGRRVDRFRAPAKGVHNSGKDV